MLTLNERVRFQGALCQVVAITPAAGNTTYKLKHVETDKVMDGDFIEDDLGRVDPKDATNEERKFREAAQKRIKDQFGEEQSQDPNDIRDRKLAAMRPADVKPPVREDWATNRTDGAPIPPLAPGPRERMERSRVGGEETPNDYSSPDGSTNKAGEAAQKFEERGQHEPLGEAGPFDPNPPAVHRDDLADAADREQTDDEAETEEQRVERAENAETTNLQGDADPDGTLRNI